MRNKRPFLRFTVAGIFLASQSLSLDASEMQCVQTESNPHTVSFSYNPDSDILSYSGTEQPGSLPKDAKLEVMWHSDTDLHFIAYWAQQSGPEPEDLGSSPVVVFRLNFGMPSLFTHSIGGIGPFVRNNWSCKRTD
jgi:hypothetical protein